MGRHAEAEPLFLRAREIRRVANGKQLPDYAESLNNLAVLYRLWPMRLESFSGPDQGGQEVLDEGSG
jgi:hypothetical protein